MNSGAKFLSAWSIFASLTMFSPCVRAEGPILYSNGAYQSPVDAGPDDLLLIPGNGLAAEDQVLYRALTFEDEINPPQSVQVISSRDVGEIPIVSAANAPFSLTVRLPNIMRADKAYALWIRSAPGQLSNSIRINDPRPLWLTPAVLYESALIANLPRYLKIVGRNLSPADGHVTQVKLLGPSTLTLDAKVTKSAIDSYVAEVTIPSKLPPGQYRVAVARDGSFWASLQGQLLSVAPDPPRVPRFSVSDPSFGGCHADDGRDDTNCIIRAIAAARSAGGGTVVFGRGTWDLVSSDQPGVTSPDGIPVPRGVSLLGEGVDSTRLIRHTDWNARTSTSAFSLLGNNNVTGFNFVDAQVYSPKDRVGSFLQIGENSDRLQSIGQSLTTPVKDVSITRNRFTRTQAAIADGGLPITRLIVTFNEFGTYNFGLELSGNLFNVSSEFRLDDSILAHNIFRPGSYIDAATHQGSIASEIGASHRLDFSDNVADGSDGSYLYSQDDARGWRAAYFFHMSGNHELLLISRNSASCTGDKVGDGEAIALDNSANTFAFGDMRPVLSATRDSVTVVGPLISTQNNREVPVRSYYIGHWVQIGDGPGIGQARKITSYTTDPATGNITFEVMPDWDVIPSASSSRISVGREFWQTYVIQNRIDHRKPPCLKSNRSRSAGGKIAVWAQTADSVIAGNQQYDADGIAWHSNFSPAKKECAGCALESFFQSFLEIRDNLIVGRYDASSNCGDSGITGWISAAPWGSNPPPTLGFGIAISHNRVIRADNAEGGAIGISQGWYAGPAPYRWPIAESTSIFHNQIEGSGTSIVQRSCGGLKPRVGIAFPALGLAWRSLLYSNECRNVSVHFGQSGFRTMRLCDHDVQDSCECLTLLHDR